MTEKERRAMIDDPDNWEPMDLGTDMLRVRRFNFKGLIFVRVEVLTHYQDYARSYEEHKTVFKDIWEGRIYQYYPGESKGNGLTPVSITQMRDAIKQADKRSAGR